MGLKSQGGSKANLNDPGAKAQLLRAAKHLFAVKGLTGTTIRDIADEAGVNSSMISYYFDGKEGLYRSCIEEIGEARFQVAKQILKPPQTREEFSLRMGLFVENLFDLFLADRDAGLIIIREYDRMHSPAEKVFKKHFLGVFDVIVTFFTQAQKKGFVASLLDPFILASIFFGTFFTQMRIDHLQDKTYKRSLRHPGERRAVIEHITHLFSTEARGHSQSHSK